MAEWGFRWHRWLPEGWTGLVMGVVAVCGLLLASLGAAGSAGAAEEWISGRTLSPPGIDARAPRVAVSADGTRMLSVWVQVREVAGQEAFRVSAAASTDGGANWADPVPVAPEAAFAGQPELALSADGTRAVVLWPSREGSDDLLRAAVSADGGATWSAPKTLDSGRTGYERIAAAEDLSRLIAVWRDSDGEVWSSASADGGVQWSARQRLTLPQPCPAQTNCAGRTISMGLAASADGSRVIAAWGRQAGGGRRIQSVVSADGGSSWSARQFLSPAGVIASGVDVGTSADGSSAAAAWHQREGSDYRVRVATSADGGIQWGQPRPISGTGFDSYDPQVAVSSDGSRMLAVWYHDPNSIEAPRAAVSDNGGAEWTTPRTLSTPGVYSSDPVLAASADARRAVVAWDGEDYVRASVLVGDTWSPQTDLTLPSQKARGQHSAMSADGSRAAVVWRIADGPINRVQARAADVPEPPEPPPVTPQPTPSATSAPPITGDTTKRTGVVAKGVKRKGVLKVRIKPDLGAKKQWRFVVKKKKSGNWRTLKRNGTKKVWKTKGARHIKKIDLPKGKYKARSRAARGYKPDTSAVVRLKR